MRLALTVSLLVTAIASIVSADGFVVSTRTPPFHERTDAQKLRLIGGVGSRLPMRGAHGKVPVILFADPLCPSCGGLTTGGGLAVIPEIQFHFAAIATDSVSRYRALSFYCLAEQEKVWEYLEFAHGYESRGMPLTSPTEPLYMAAVRRGLTTLPETKKIPAGFPVDLLDRIKANRLLFADCMSRTGAAEKLAEMNALVKELEAPSVPFAVVGTEVSTDLRAASIRELARRQVRLVEGLDRH